MATQKDKQIVEDDGTMGCMSFRGDLCKLFDLGIFINQQKR